MITREQGVQLNRTATMTGADTKPKSMATPLVLAVIAIILAAASVVVLGYLGVVLGDRGLHADATGTAGYTTPVEAITLVCGVLGAIVFTVLFVVFLVVAIQRRHSISRS